jgi:hypothetical protein
MGPRGAHCVPFWLRLCRVRLNAGDPRAYYIGAWLLATCPIDMLPSLRPDTDRSNTTTLAATGTEGSIAHRQLSVGDDRPTSNPALGCTEGQPISEIFAHYLPTGGDVLNRDQSNSVVSTGSNGEESIKGLARKKAALTHPSASSRVLSVVPGWGLEPQTCGL